VSAPPIPSAPADLELIAQLKSKLQYAELRIRVLEERLLLMRIEKYGAGGEKLSQAQMQLFEIEPVVRSCRRIFLVLSGFCHARQISEYANAAAKKRW
jgi:hypothetical protein